MIGTSTYKLLLILVYVRMLRTTTTKPKTITTTTITMNDEDEDDTSAFFRCGNYEGYKKSVREQTSESSRTEKPRSRWAYSSHCWVNAECRKSTTTPNCNVGAGWAQRARTPSYWSSACALGRIVIFDYRHFVLLLNY